MINPKSRRQTQISRRKTIADKQDDAKKDETKRHDKEQV
ncbi:twin arginine translocase protein A [Klebsiella pneumoniae]|uniref:Twin arginine translocase protein A n=1 Tax=Klebsiella pneumoniae TaxID=573 RepID=A0A378ATP3_KLEPN|nr:twin arginine translocase protein A [Klebsiella pneumoniae]